MHFCSLIGNGLDGEPSFGSLRSSRSAQRACTVLTFIAIDTAGACTGAYRIFPVFTELMNACEALIDVGGACTEVSQSPCSQHRAHGHSDILTILFLRVRLTDDYLYAM